MRKVSKMMRKKKNLFRKKKKLFRNILESMRNKSRLVKQQYENLAHEFEACCARLFERKHCIQSLEPDIIKCT